jgi:transposase
MCIFNQMVIQNGQKKYSKELKYQIALDTIKGQKTIEELASKYGVHTNKISIWKKQLLDADSVAFSNRKNKDTEKKVVEGDYLYQNVCHLQNEVDGLKIKTGYLV